MTEPNASQLPRWERSPNFRTIFSSYFQFRYSVGDGNITFSQYSEDPGSPTQNIIQEEVRIIMSWPSLKLLGEYLTTAVQEMERELGPIATVGLPKEELRKQAVAIVKGFGIRKND
jgi:hypothetical protein